MAIFVLIIPRCNKLIACCLICSVCDNLFCLRQLASTVILVFFMLRQNQAYNWLHHAVDLSQTMQMNCVDLMETLVVLSDIYSQVELRSWELLTWFEFIEKWLIIIRVNWSVYHWLVNLSSLWFLHQVPTAIPNNRNMVCYRLENWKEDLLQHIDAEQLPVHWGGTRTDPDGDPFCKSQVSK